MKNKTYRFSIFTLHILFLSIILFFNSCGKKWKQTTTVDFQFYISPSEPTDFLQFTSGEMKIREIDFSGDRKKGGGVNFTNSISNGAVLNLNNGIATPLISYDIPQGTYNKINLTIKAFDEDPSPSISLYGFYMEDSSETIPIIFEFHSGQNFNVSGKTNAGQNQIVLIEDKPATCKITFDPNYWFDTVTENLLDDADETIVDGESTIVINETNNTIIYNLISSRISEATKAVFQ